MNEYSHNNIKLVKNKIHTLKSKKYGSSIQRHFTQPPNQMINKNKNEFSLSNVNVCVCEL